MLVVIKHLHHLSHSGTSIGRRESAGWDVEIKCALYVISRYIRGRCYA